MKRFLQKNSKHLQSFKKISEHTKIMKARSEKREIRGVPKFCNAAVKKYGDLAL
jgi:hypothetical protein